MIIDNPTLTGILTGGFQTTPDYTHILVEKAVYDYMAQGWIPIAGGGTVIYVSSNSFKINKNLTDFSILSTLLDYNHPLPIGWAEGGSTYKYGYCLSAVWDGTYTTLTILGNSVANTTITNVLFSLSNNALGFPVWFNYTTSLASTTGTITSYTTLAARFCIVGKTIRAHQEFQVTNNGTGSGALNILMPIAPAHYPAPVGCNPSTLKAMIGQYVGSNLMQFNYYDGSYPVVTSQYINFDEEYEF